MNQTDYFSVKFIREDAFGENQKIVFLDQTKLPLKEEYIETDDYERIAKAIERLEIRGAPLIGIAAAYALALSLKNKNSNHQEVFNSAYERLASTRPTAVNLFKALDDIRDTFNKIIDKKDLFEICLSKAIEIHKKDAEFCSRIGKNGLAIFKQKANVLTHCNTGKLATGGIGTAFGIIKTAFENGLVNHVFADETRPLLQGLRLTAYELDKSKIPFTLLTDSSAAELMKEGKVDLVITGADRIALNGDSANKIGTYNLAILSNFHNIPFYIAAPSTTIDNSIATGDEIVIEFRNKNELFIVGETKISPQNYHAFTPAFDITPAHLISGIITEEGIFSFPYNFIR